MGTLLDIGLDSSRDGVGGDEECDDDEKIRAEVSIVKSLLCVVSDGSPLVRAEVAVGMCCILNLNCSVIFAFQYSRDCFLTKLMVKQDFDTVCQLLNQTESCWGITPLSDSSILNKNVTCDFM